MRVVVNCGYLQGSLHLLKATDVLWFCRVHLYFSLNLSKPYTIPAVLTEMEFALCASGKALPSTSSYTLAHFSKITNVVEITKTCFEQIFVGQMTKISNDFWSETLCSVCEPSINVWNTAFLVKQGRLNIFSLHVWYQSISIFNLNSLYIRCQGRENISSTEIKESESPPIIQSPGFSGAQLLWLWVMWVFPPACCLPSSWFAYFSRNNRRNINSVYLHISVLPFCKNWGTNQYFQKWTWC